MQEAVAIIQQFQDIQLRGLIQGFFNKRTSFGGKNGIIYSESKFEIIINLSFTLSSKDVTWDWIQNTFDSYKETVHKQGFIILVAELLANNFYQGSFRQIVNSFVDENGINLQHRLYHLFQNHLTPLNLIVIKIACPQRTRKTVSSTTFFTDIDNLFLYNLLKQFIESYYHACCVTRMFFEHFHRSLNYKSIESISDFSTETFHQQYNFFKGETGLKNHKITLLKTFYRMLSNTEEGKNILRWQDGVDYYMLQNASFCTHYENGFKLIPLNPIDPVPLVDKWLIMPNGAQNSTKIKTYQYVPFDFSAISDEKLKFALKHWCWNETLALPSRNDYCRILIKFFFFINELRNKYHLNEITHSYEKDTFTIEEIYAYLIDVKINGSNSSYISTVKKFLTYISENQLYSVPVHAFSYFSVKAASPKKQAEDIANEDLIRLEEKLKNNASKSLQHTLQHIIFHIALSTEMRISQILNLKINYLNPSTDNLESTSKVSHGDLLKVPTSPYTKRFLETALQLTQSDRDRCLDTNLKQYLFLQELHENSFKVMDNRIFNDYLKKICIEINIKPFTAQNLRCTYMTKAVEFIIRTNKSLLELKTLTLHKSFNTTNNHYVAKKIKDYLEATYLIICEDVNIQGIITNQQTQYTIPEKLVNDNCGYCSKESCVIFNGLDCLICKGFIATLDRIPFFELKIKSIIELIETAQLSHDKEHLLVIKKLYIAYLEKLYILREELMENE